MEDRGTLEAEHGLESLGLTGQTVANIEIADRLQEAIPLYVGIVVVLCLVLLMAVFRSLAAPVLAAAGYVLSLAASWARSPRSISGAGSASFSASTSPGPSWPSSRS